MATKVLVPLLGEGVEEVSIVAWLKAEGDVVAEYEGLLEVETDKVVTEIGSPAAGVVLKILEQEDGKSVSVGTLLAWIGEEGESLPDSHETPARAQSEATGVDEQPAPVVEEVMPEPEAVSLKAAPQAVGRNSAFGFISPVVARIAAEKSIDLQYVNGTGRGGRITKADVLAYGSKPKAESVPSISSASSTLQGGTVIPMTSVRRSIAKHMVESRKTSPHVTTVMEVDLSNVMAHRQENKAAYARDGVKLTFTPYFVAASVAALKAFPIVNSSWSEAGIVLHKAINIGMATSLGEDGLIVPVIKNAERLSLLGLAGAVNDLAERARAKQLKPDEVRDGTFSITNHGVSGSLFAMPIINQPQVAILGVGAIRKRVLVVTDAKGGDLIAIRPMVYLTLTFDHRVLDGAVADYFLSEVVRGLERGEW